MSNLKKTFLESLQKGFDAAKLITEPKDKAIAYAQLAQAIATTGLIDNAEIEEKDENKETTTKKKTSGKDSLKAESGKGNKKEEVVAEEPTTPEKVEETSEVVEDNWDSEEIRSQYEEQLTRLQAYVDAWGEDYVYTDLLNAWTEGAFNGADNVRPSNIDGFLTYIDALVEQSEAQ
jgi:hypothetical protein